MKLYIYIYTYTECKSQTIYTHNSGMHVPKSWLYGLRQLAKRVNSTISSFFFIGEISPKNNIKILKFENLSDFGGDSQSPKLRKNHQIFINGFQCLAKNIEGNHLYMLYFGDSVISTIFF